MPGIVQKRLRLLMGRRDYAGWALAAAEPVFDPAGARLLFRAPDGRGALLTLAEATPGRVQVGWDLPDDGDRDGLRRVTEAVGAALRGRRR